MQVYLQDRDGEVQELDGIYSVVVRTDDGDWIGRLYEIQQVLVDGFPAGMSGVGAELDGLCMMNFHGTRLFRAEGGENV